MDFGKVEYVVGEGSGGAGRRSLRLTLVGQGDEDTLAREGLAALRRRRIKRLVGEAKEQGYSISFEDLASLLLTSLATLKRDVKFLEDQGEIMDLRGRRKNGNGSGGGRPDGGEG